ncbi:MAG: LPS-assembly protein LptD [Acidobacteria bacterium]|nr:MAG: LPS-assembly protein LptD [Acidobacteriota bacterium]
MRPLAAVLWLWLLACPLAAQFDEVEPASPIPEETPAEIVEDQQEPVEPEPAEPIRFDRISFEVPFPEDQGGGTATGTAGNLEYLRENYVIASGGVEVRYQDMEFQAQQVELDLETKVITARGDVIVDQGPNRMTGDTLTFELESKTGTMTNAKAFVDPDMYFEGEEIAKVGEESYTVTDGMVTSCSGDSPAWIPRRQRTRRHRGICTGQARPVPGKEDAPALHPLHDVPGQNGTPVRFPVSKPRLLRASGRCPRAGLFSDSW